MWKSATHNAKAVDEELHGENVTDGSPFDFGMLDLDRDFPSVSERGSVHLGQRGGAQGLGIETQENISGISAQIFPDHLHQFR